MWYQWWGDCKVRHHAFAVCPVHFIYQTRFCFVTDVIVLIQPSERCWTISVWRIIFRSTILHCQPPCRHWKEHGQFWSASFESYGETFTICRTLLRGNDTEDSTKTVQCKFGMYIFTKCISLPNVRQDTSTKLVLECNSTARVPSEHWRPSHNLFPPKCTLHRFFSN